MSTLEKIDLHCHSVLSDGTVSVPRLIDLAAAQGIGVLSITDHDTLAGGRLGAIWGKQKGIRVIPGVEISARDYQRGRKVHILCYMPGEGQAALLNMLAKTRKSRASAMRAAICKVCKIYPVPLELILEKSRGSATPFKQHVMAALTDAGYADGIFGEVFQKLFHPKTGLAHEPVTYPDIYEVLETVRSAGAIAVLAHPGEYDSLALMEELCQKQLLQGLELNHPRNSEAVKAQIRTCAAHYGLVCTGGTDFHGAFTKTPMPLGSYLTEEGAFRALMKNMFMMGE